MYGVYFNFIYVHLCLKLRLKLLVIYLFAELLISLVPWEFFNISRETSDVTLG